MKNSLIIKRISKQYGGRQVVKEASFEVASGQVVGLLGPNGAGKTTSFYMVVGLVQPDQGEILLNDLNITDFPMYKRARAGLSYLAQEPSIFRKLTVEENILVALEAHGYPAHEGREKLESLLQDFRVNHIRNSKGMSLSGGERRRVEIARALAGSPEASASTASRTAASAKVPIAWTSSSSSASSSWKCERVISRTFPSRSPLCACRTGW